MPQRSKGSQAPARGRHADRERGLHDQVTALVHGDHGDPFSLLGLHAEEPDQFVARCYHPAASKAWVLDRAGNVIAELEQQFVPVPEEGGDADSRSRSKERSPMVPALNKPLLPQE